MKNHMIPIPFERLLSICLEEYRTSGTLFYVPVETFTSAFVSPIGPAAGPHTQMTQNIVAAWAAGARHFELKTVQILEGEELGIVKPCIAMKGGVYNTEWSTELTVAEAGEEYVKAWFLIHLLTKEFSLEDAGAPVFYMSVGYTLEGIKSARIDGFIELMKDARKGKVWGECEKAARENANLFSRVTDSDIGNIPPAICGTVTLSTMHGCPAGQIEEIAVYLSETKGLDVFLKMNPTLLGLERAAVILEERGYDTERLIGGSFAHDLAFTDAVEMLKRLLARAQKTGRKFGVKLTNTLPVKSRGELAGDTLYLSGAYLLPLAAEVAALLAKEFGNALPISYSGGADKRNIAALAAAGLFPITVSSCLLAPGGYKNLTFMNRALAKTGYRPCTDPDATALSLIARGEAHPGEAFTSAAVAAARPAADYSVPVCPAARGDGPETAEKDECGRCSSCVDVCPNRANVPVVWDGRRTVRHDSTLCNECGACVFLCIEGRTPWRDKKEIDRKGDK